MFGDELDDEGLGGDQPLPPEDRLWRHPSEVGASARASQPEPPRGRPSRRPRAAARLWLVVIVAGISGAAAAVGAMVVVAAMPPRVENRATITPVVASVTTASLTANPKTVRRIVSDTETGIVEITVVAHGTEQTGSGIIVRADGVLITSAALVAPTKTVTVELSDGRSTAGTVAGSDPGSGLAVVRVPLTGLRVAPTDDTTPLPGDRAVLVAGPVSAGNQPWVSSGVISSVDRQVDVGDRTLSGMIETDRPVPAAADGGALVDADGSITGVCLAVSKGGNLASGYAVPISVARAVSSDLLTYGRARHAWMGVQGDDLSAADSRKLGVPGGAVISVVTPSSPAAVAGLDAGDVVVRLDTTTLRSMDDLLDVLPSFRPDDRVDLTVLRGGNELTISVTLGDRPVNG